MADIIQIRRDTAANWTSADPTLALGEIGYETDTYKFKVGDGSTTWTSLAYITLDGNAIHDNVANEITAITLKASPVDADELIIEDSDAGYVKKSITLGSIGGGIGMEQISYTGNATIDHDIATIFTTVHFMVFVRNAYATLGNVYYGVPPNLYYLNYAQEAQLDHFSLSPQNIRLEVAGTPLNANGTDYELIVWGEV